MRKYLPVLLAALLAMPAVRAQNDTPPDWENPLVVQINREPVRATYTPYSDSRIAIEMGSSSREMSLNGRWKFHWVPRPEERPVDFYKPSFDVSGWDEILVPGQWETQGYGTPLYVNIRYPFHRDPPRVTGEPPRDFTSYEERNPVGSYRQTFEIPETWKGQRVFITFHGVMSAFYVWVNGERVGYAQDSMCPDEFDITPYLRDGGNVLAVEVYKFSDGSYLEDQDMWRFAGIFRDVTLIARPAVHLHDFHIVTDLDEDYEDATVTIDLDLRNQSEMTANAQVRVDVYSPEGAQIHTDTVTFDNIAVGAFERRRATFEMDDPDLWSAETPTLYKVVLTVLDASGKETESIPWRFGVREYEFRDKQFWVNGKSIKLKGVNRHEHHPRMGRHVDLETMIQDVRMIKQANINYVRTAHYPDDYRFYHLADEYGLYLMDEANQESHDFGTGSRVLGDDPNWMIAHVDRGISMVERDKNHASVAIWSLGNEGGSGRNLRVMRESMEAIDATRPYYYHGDESVSDWIDIDYPRVEDLERFVLSNNPKGANIREYSHMMGNSGGNLQEHWDFIYQHPEIVGAAIWDWVDQGLARKIDGGNRLTLGDDPTRLSLDEDEYFAYGGEFGDVPNNMDFCINGMVGPDRVPNPHYYEVRKVYQYVWMRGVDPASGRINVMNHYDFLNTAAFDWDWKLLEDGRVVARGTMPPVDLAPGAQKEIIVPIPDLPAGDSELILQVEVKLRRDELWAPAGWAVAAEQFIVRESPFSKLRPGYDAALHVEEGNNSITVRGSEFNLTWDRTNGALTGFEYRGWPLLKQTQEPYFWKPTNRNQSRNQYEQRLGPWREAAAQRRLRETTVVTDDRTGNVTVQFEFGLPVADADYTLTYMVNTLGHVSVEADYKPNAAEAPKMPKFGVRLGIPEEFDRITWYGRGPWENYWDRKTGAFLGVYSAMLDDYWTNYIYPQDNGNREDIRWWQATDSHGNGVRIEGMQELSIRAWPFTEADIMGVRLPQHLPRRDFINVNVDLRVYGVGGDNSWGARTMDKYTLPGEVPYAYGFILKPVLDGRW